MQWRLVEQAAAHEKNLKPRLARYFNKRVVPGHKADSVGPRGRG
jgi:hypothetical protein